MYLLRNFKGLRYNVLFMSLNEFYFEFHAIESKIKSSKDKSSDRLFQEFALNVYKQADYKSIS